MAYQYRRSVLRGRKKYYFVWCFSSGESGNEEREWHPGLTPSFRPAPESRQAWDRRLVCPEPTARTTPQAPNAVGHPRPPLCAGYCCGPLVHGSVSPGLRHLPSGLGGDNPALPRKRVVGARAGRKSTFTCCTFLVNETVHGDL